MRLLRLAARKMQRHPAGRAELPFPAAQKHAEADRYGAEALVRGDRASIESRDARHRPSHPARMEVFVRALPELGEHNAIASVWLQPDIEVPPRRTCIHEHID